MLSQEFDRMNFTNHSRKVFDEPPYINQTPVTRRGIDHFAQLSRPNISDHPERIERSSLDSTPNLLDNNTPFSPPFIGGNQNPNQQLPCQNYSYITGPNNGNLIRTYGPNTPNNIPFNPYYSYSQFDNSSQSSQPNSVLPIQAFPNNQGGSIWPISYINPNTYHNNVQYPVENVPFPQNAQLENLASMRQVNPIYINEGHPNDSSARQQHYGMGEKQGLFCSVCKKADDDPTYRRDLKMYVCRYCGGGFCNNYGENRNTIQSRKHASSHKIDACCSNCKTNTTSLWRRSSNGEPICNACGLYFKLHGTNRPLSMKKDEIQTRTRRSNRTDRFRMSKVVTRSGTQAQYLPGRGQPDNHSYQGNNYSDHQAQANHAI